MDIQLKRETCSIQFKTTNHRNQDSVINSDTEILNIDLVSHFNDL